MATQSRHAAGASTSPVRSFELRNERGTRVRLIDWGATLTGVTFDGAEILLGTGDPDAYVEGYPAAAATIGRVANRIGLARFELDGTVHTLDANDGMHHLHGGGHGFRARRWTVDREFASGAERALRLALRSPDGEAGYPGTLAMQVTFALEDDDALRIEYVATTDRATPLNPTNHAYWNLAGRGNVLSQLLWIDADGYLPVDDERIPTGEIASVTGTPFDFREPRSIGARFDAVLDETGGYDHCLVLREGRDVAVPCMRVTDPGSGRTLEVLTTEPGVQLYTGNHLEGVPGRGGEPLPRWAGVALETQGFPDAVNNPQFPSVILRPGETYRSATTYRFLS